MSNDSNFNPDDEQLKLEMQAMAELLLDIYEYRLQTKMHPDGLEAAVLDGNQCDRRMKERSTTFKSKHNIE